MREKNRGKSVRMVGVVGAVGMVGAVGTMGGVVIIKIINFGKGCSLISY